MDLTSVLSTTLQYYTLLLFYLAADSKAADSLVEVLAAPSYIQHEWERRLEYRGILVMVYDLCVNLY